MPDDRDDLDRDDRVDYASPSTRSKLQDLNDPTAWSTSAPLASTSTPCTDAVPPRARTCTSGSTRTSGG